ncbi:Hypp9371 [Branchiostoma lanceolatum]|uniref:Hypp9371 protein n=1 Tax=Branchiostoma lanceolatum TaxID=7740 RepID=A0A8S4MLQ3_BRALA|nr:Hypp9371 [Branchiostoma lanceolatum]
MFYIVLTMCFIAFYTETDTECSPIDQNHPDTDQECSSSSESLDESESSQSDPGSDNLATQDDTEESQTDCDTEAEIWEGSEGEEQLLRDLHTSAVNDSTAPFTKRARSDPAITVVTWLLTFLLIWQAQNHVSDNGLEHLMSFLCPVFESLGVESSCLRGLSSLYLTWKILGIDRDSFKKYCVCPNPKCCKLYDMDKLYEVVNGVERPRRCDNTRRVRRRDIRCNTIISRQTVTTVSQRRVYYPLKVYCFKSIIESLECLVKKQGFEEKCEAWREREVSQAGLYGDIFEGKVWKDFQKWNGEDFLSVENNFGLMINMDFFQPFKRRNDYSVGVIYMTVMNLPRSERFKLENVLLVGVIPALEHEPKSLNRFLDPIVTELKFLWRGVSYTTYKSPYYPLEFRAALLCCAADIPAARKLCGFLGHTAEIGCSKCKKAFKKVGTKTNYSGFDRGTWPLRNDTEHKRQAVQINSCTNNARRQRLEKKFGTRYTPLLELEYYQAIRFCVIDPMHNLFLGTAKRMFKTWVDQEILSKTDLEVISQRIESVVVPPGLGRIPKGIASNFGAFTAEEWKNWTLYYSSYCLDGLLPKEHLDCWQLFVLACKKICQPVVRECDVRYADAAFVNFGKKVEHSNLYGKLFVTPNMHLHCHLKQCILDYGPVYGFWLFSFERFNGILGSECTNNRGIEIQLMRKFLISGFAHSVPLPTDLYDVFGSLFAKFYSKNSNVDISTNVEINLQTTATTLNVSDIDWSEDPHTIKLPINFTRVSLSRDEKCSLAGAYSSMYPEGTISNMAATARKYSTCQVGQEYFGSKVAARSRNSACIMGRWATNEGSIDVSSELRPGIIQCFYRHAVEIDGKLVTHIFAVVEWYKLSPMKDRIGQGKCCTTWKKSFVCRGSASFMPVKRIYCKTVCAHTMVDGQKVVVVSPVIRKTYL